MQVSEQQVKTEQDQLLKTSSLIFSLLSFGHIGLFKGDVFKDNTSLSTKGTFFISTSSVDN